MAPDSGGKEGNYMKSKIKYTDEPMGKLKVISDFLPAPDQLVLKEDNIKVTLAAPDQLVLKEDNIKVTLALKKSSIEFFKKEAKKHHTSYQKMIRQLVDWYTSHHQKSA